MTAEEKREDKRLIEAGWVSLCLFVSLAYVSGEITKSLIAALFVLVSMSLDIAGRRLAQLGVVVCILAIAISFGFPVPGRWPDLVAQMLAHFSTLRVG
jgi:hypothetical protein